VAGGFPKLPRGGGFILMGRFRWDIRVPTFQSIPILEKPTSVPNSIQRRQFLKLTTGTAIAGSFFPTRSRAEASIGSIYQTIIPARKGLDAAWAMSLVKRGAPLDAGIRSEVKADLGHIGMTVGGIGCGTVYLSGDGQLFVWDIFNQPHEGVVASKVQVPAGLENISGAKKQVRERDGSNYIVPPTPDHHPNPFQQGFELSIEGAASPRPMDGSGWEAVKFTGRWPLGIVEYSDPACPVFARLEAWTPFIPLSTADSSLPVTVMEYTLENRSDKPVKGSLTGILANPVLVHTRRLRAAEVASRISKKAGTSMLIHQAGRAETPGKPARPDIVFEDFERPAYAPWTTEGVAFGTGPVEAGAIPAYQGKLDQHGKRLVNSHTSAPGDDVGVKDNATGTLTSPEFAISRRHVRLLLGGGKRPGETGIEVLVDGKVVASATGRGENTMTLTFIDVSKFEGKTARLRIIDRAGGAWANTSADHIVFTDVIEANGPVEGAGDFGSATLSLLGGATANPNDALDRLEAGFEIPPSGTRTIRFLITWHFPNLRAFPKIGKQVPQYSTRFPDAAAVAREVAGRFEKLREDTMRWVATWNDSTLPQWLLDRAILTTNTLQTTTCQIFGDGRFWAWEGIGCCPGTCAHVWHYAQGVARLFPDLERNLREVTDYGIAINKDGSIRFRAEASDTVAIDAQTGIILRTWREHLISPNGKFLKRIWPAAKRALEWLVRFDEDGRGGLDGLLDGKQHNTLDAEWYGKVHCLCSLYLASLRAGQEMALQAGDNAFAATCGKVHAMGAKKIASLFNGEFYIQDEDPAFSTAIGVGHGCYIDQVIGQWWASQIGLGRIYDADQIRKALHSLWRYNFVPEVGNFRQTFKQGRFYALPGEAGLVMCTWPKGGLRDDFKKHWQYAYFNECMSGFEWQAAAHMLQEGAPIHAADFGKSGELLEDSGDPRSLTARGLAIGRAIHDRYSTTRRNPYNEIECSDHYARANASYSLFLAACGFEYNGPEGIIGFDPKISPEDFKAPFTAAEGWGSFSQKQANGKSWTAGIVLAHGSLSLREIRMPWLTAGAKVRLGDKDIPSTSKSGSLRFPNSLDLTSGGPELTILSAAG
jgi:non-lysosomal glucosylceramidase